MSTGCPAPVRFTCKAILLVFPWKVPTFVGHELPHIILWASAMALHSPSCRLVSRLLWTRLLPLHFARQRLRIGGVLAFLFAPAFVVLHSFC